MSNWLKFRRKKAFHLCALLRWWNRVYRRSAEHLLHLSRVHARQVQKSFCFKF